MLSCCITAVEHCFFIPRIIGLAILKETTMLCYILYGSNFRLSGNFYRIPINFIYLSFNNLEEVLHSQLNIQANFVLLVSPSSASLVFLFLLQPVVSNHRLFYKVPPVRLLPPEILANRMFFGFIFYLVCFLRSCLNF